MPHDVSATRMERFLRTRDPVEALVVWLELKAGDRVPARRAIAERLAHDIASLDRLLGAQLDALLHHPQFQKLEASWRGLHYLVSSVPEDSREWVRELRRAEGKLSSTDENYDAPQVAVRLFELTWNDLRRDLTRTGEVEQSWLFRKIYEEEFGMSGGHPFGLLLGDWEFAHSPHESLEVLQALAQIAHAAMAPFVAAAAPRLLDEEFTSFADLERGYELAGWTRGARKATYAKWIEFCNTEEARFVGLVLPRTLMRAPWSYDPERIDGFRYRENTTQRDTWAWGNAIWAFGAVVVRAFAELSWLAAIRGIDEDDVAAGVYTAGHVGGLPRVSFPTDRAGIAPRGALEVQITDARERELAKLGLIALCQLPGTFEAAVYSVLSVQQPKRFDQAEADASSRLSSMLHYMLCASRFGHYLKVIGRNWVGKYATSEQLEQQLERWLQDYKGYSDDMSDEQMAKHPLANAEVSVREVPGKPPGTFSMEAHLQPHYQLDRMGHTITLRAELVQSRR